jgi:hypothetical protein
VSKDFAVANKKALMRSTRAQGSAQFAHHEKSQNPFCDQYALARERGLRQV